MRARLFTVASVVVLIASACSSTPATPAPTAAPTAAPADSRADRGSHGRSDGGPHGCPDGSPHGGSRRAAPTRGVPTARSDDAQRGAQASLRVARISDFLPSIHPSASAPATRN